MSRTTNESEDAMLSKDQIDSPLVDEGSSGGTGVGGIVLKKGPWTSAEDAILVEYVKKHGEGNWNAVQKHSGLFRCGKSCRLRWANHLRPNLKKGAFTAEEERLIIELHAKMGNKWARMAAHLPGRTDNEIKNYWNTRIKRRQRAGLPLYPPEVCLQAVQGSQQSHSNSGDGGHHDLLQNIELPDVIFDSLKVNQGILPYIPDFPDVSANSMLLKGLGSSQYYSFLPSTSDRHKRLRESTPFFPSYDGSARNGLPILDQIHDDSCGKVSQMQDDACYRFSRSLGFSLPYDVEPDSKNSFSSAIGQGSFLNGNSSASKPTSGAMKLELPSLQYPETDLGSWGTSFSSPHLLESVDSFIQSPPIMTFVDDCVSPRNSGLLDALLYEAKTLSSGKNHASDKSSNSSTVTPGERADSSNLNISETEWEDYGDPISPLGHSAASIFSEYTPISACGSSLDERPPSEIFPGCNVKMEPVDLVWASDVEHRETSAHVDFSRPDALLGSDWLEQSGGCVKDQARVTDAILSFAGDDFSNEYEQMGGGTSISSSGGWGLDFCGWNNMPAVCHMSELP